MISEVFFFYSISEQTIYNSYRHLVLCDLSKSGEASIFPLWIFFLTHSLTFSSLRACPLKAQ